jgi:uncharacterized membrane protein
VALIRSEIPQWPANSLICQHCLNQKKMEYARKLLLAEKGTLSEMDQEVLATIGSLGLVVVNPNERFEQSRSWSERLSDRVTVAIGSWSFATTVFFFLAGWVSLNILFKPFDPYPVIILAVISAVLGSLAALQGPIILMSQRRQARLDRLRAENDYRLNLKAELEIRYLAEKLDHLLKVLSDEPG